MVFGYFFIIVGILLLLNELGLISGSFWGFLWAMLFIVVGINMIAGKKEDNCCYFPWHKHHSKKHHDDTII